MKFVLIKRKLLTLAVCLLCAAAMFYIVSHPAVVGASAVTRQLPIYCVQRDQKLVSLTFDAAWGNEDTQQLIDILAQYNVKATFFVVGAWVDKYPESVKALSDAGHEVMNHSNDHAHFNSLSAEEIAANINACNDKIEAVTGARPTLFRPPYGEYDDHVISTVRAQGMEPIQWDVEALAAVGKPWGAIDSSSKKVKMGAVDSPGACRNTLRGFSFLLCLDWRSEPFGCEKNHSPQDCAVTERLQCRPGTCQHDSNSHHASTFLITTCSIT